MTLWIPKLDQNGHENLVEVHAEFFHCQEGPFIELTGPNFLDGQPGLVPLGLLDAKIGKLTLHKLVVLIFFMELEPEDQVFALIKHLVHLLHALNLVRLFNQRIKFLLRVGLQTDRILSHLERNDSALWKLHILVQFISQIPQIIGLGTRVLVTEGVHEHEGLGKHWWWLELVCSLDGIVEDQVA